MSTKSSGAPSKIERIQTAVEQLSTVAAHINNASDELAKPIAKLEAVLKKYGLGVPTWVVIRQGGDAPEHWEEELGYAKYDGRWRIAIRSVHGDLRDQDNDTYEFWPFNEAPRHLRIAAIENIPDLLEMLIAETMDMTTEILTKRQELDAMVDAMESASEESGKLRSGKEGNKYAE